MKGAEQEKLQQAAVRRMRSVYQDNKLVGMVPETGNYKADRDAAFQLLKDKGLYREVTTQQAMYRQAMAFGQTALLVNRQLQAGGGLIWLVPLVINHALAMEMLLKALAKAHGGSPARSHDLAKLHTQLPAAARKAIDAAVAKLPPPSGYTLETVLQNLAESFTRWRYYFDMGGSAGRFNIPSAMWAATVLEQACVDSGMKP